MRYWPLHLRNRQYLSKVQHKSQTNHWVCSCVLVFLGNCRTKTSNSVTYLWVNLLLVGLEQISREMWWSLFASLWAANDLDWVLGTISVWAIYLVSWRILFISSYCSLNNIGNDYSCCDNSYVAAVFNRLEITKENIVDCLHTSFSIDIHSAGQNRLVYLQSRFLSDKNIILFCLSPTICDRREWSESLKQL